jgi:hypothetical protein
VRRLADPGLRLPRIAQDCFEPRLRGRIARLTNEGEVVLAGSMNAIELNGIDDWIGGVHLAALSRAPIVRGRPRLYSPCVLVYLIHYPNFVASAQQKEVAMRFEN